jgi:histidinol-phosphate aminotransferase
MLTNRRHWLQQSVLALTGLTVAPPVFGNRRNVFSAPSTSILLNSNENPYGPSPLARQAILENYLKSNRYPDDYINPLKQKIAAHWGVAAENILMGAGSSEIIGLATLHASQKKKKIVTAEPAYRVWNGQAESFGLAITRTPLTADKKFDLNALLAAIDDDTAMVYICNPNNPTGTAVEVSALKNFAVEASKKTMVFIDEAYTEYAGLESLASLAITNKNIVVAKTFSKIYGLAGARVGYAITHADTTNRLGKYQAWPDFSLSAVSAAAASASLDDSSFVKDCRVKTEQAKELCYETFVNLSLNHISSRTNFILFNIDPFKKAFIKEMEARHIYVQFRNHFGGKWCRVSMGSLDEMQFFCTALKEMI